MLDVQHVDRIDKEDHFVEKPHKKFQSIIKYNP